MQLALEVTNLDSKSLLSHNSISVGYDFDPLLGLYIACTDTMTTSRCDRK